MWSYKTLINDWQLGSISGRDLNPTSALWPINLLFFLIDGNRLTMKNRLLFFLSHWSFSLSPLYWKKKKKTAVTVSGRWVRTDVSLNKLWLRELVSCLHEGFDYIKPECCCRFRGAGEVGDVDLMRFLGGVSPQTLTDRTPTGLQ